MEQIIISSEIYTCGRLDKFIKSIKAILPYRGYSNSQFFIIVVKDGKESHRILTKLAFYRKSNKEIYSDPNPDTIHQSDAEIKILTLLKEQIIATGLSNNIISIIYYNTCEGNINSICDEINCDKLTNDQSGEEEVIVKNLFCKNRDLIAAGLNQDKYSFICMEQGDITLRKYITKYINYNIIGATILKSLIFQLVHCYNVIRDKWPDFRHNDLHTDNVLCIVDPDYKFDHNNPQKIELKFGNKTYRVPFFGIVPKIIDFGFSSIKSLNIVSHITDDKSIMFNRPENDLLFLFYDINDYVEIEPIVELIDQLDPSGYYHSFDAAFLRRHPEIAPTPQQMMDSEEWSEYVKH